MPNRSLNRTLHSQVGRAHLFTPDITNCRATMKLLPDGTIPPNVPIPHATQYAAERLALYECAYRVYIYTLATKSLTVRI